MAGCPGHYSLSRRLSLSKPARASATVTQSESARGRLSHGVSEPGRSGPWASESESESPGEPEQAGPGPAAAPTARVLPATISSSDSASAAGMIHSGLSELNVTIQVSSRPGHTGRPALRHRDTVRRPRAGWR